MDKQTNIDYDYGRRQSRTSVCDQRPGGCGVSPDLEVWKTPPVLGEPVYCHLSPAKHTQCFYAAYLFNQCDHKAISVAG